MTAPGKITHCVDLNGSDGKQAVNPPFALVLNQTSLFLIHYWNGFLLIILSLDVILGWISFQKQQQSEVDRIKKKYLIKNNCEIQNLMQESKLK